jgi:hypothetical protein
VKILPTAGVLSMDTFKESISYRVARWFVFKPKIPIWVNFEEPLNGKCWYIF